MRPFAHRLSKLEARANPPRRIPHVLEIRRGETFAEARARFVERWGAVATNHQFLGVPEKPATPEDEAACDAWIEIQQAALITFGRRHNHQRRNR